MNRRVVGAECPPQDRRERVAPLAPTFPCGGRGPVAHESFCVAYSDDIQNGIIHRFHAEWLDGAQLRIGDKGGPPYEDEKFISFGPLDNQAASDLAIWLISRMPPELRAVTLRRLARYADGSVFPGVRS